MEFKLSICSLIYRSTVYADAVYASLMENTQLLQSGKARFFFVANDPTNRVVKHLKEKKYPYVIQRNQTLAPVQLANLNIGPPEYIRRVYQGWNRAVIESDEIAVLVNSDMMFSQGWLEALLKHLDTKTIVASQLVERHDPKRPIFPSAIPGNFGKNPLGFKAKEFREFVELRRNSEVMAGGAYSPIVFFRSLLVDNNMLFPEGNLASPERPGVVSRYGDEFLFAELKSTHGMTHKTACDSVVYHFKEGEMLE